MLDTQNCLQNHIKMLKQPSFFHSQPSKLSKDTLTKFYLSTTFGLSFIISSVAPTRSSIFYAYLVTKIGNRNLKPFSDRGGNRGKFPEISPLFWIEVITEACFQNKPTQQDKGNVLRVAVSTFAFRIE